MTFKNQHRAHFSSHAVKIHDQGLNGYWTKVHQICSYRPSIFGDAEFVGVKNAGVEISGEEKVWKAKR